MTTKAQRDVQEKTDQVLAALRRHPRGIRLVMAGYPGDSLLRALVPLYSTERYGLEGIITSGVTQKVWAAHGIRVQATVMAKALREHVGYARHTREGWRITPNGLKYVEAALR